MATKNTNKHSIHKITTVGLKGANIFSRNIGRHLTVNVVRKLFRGAILGPSLGVDKVKHHCLRRLNFLITLLSQLISLTYLVLLFIYFSIRLTILIYLLF